MNLCIVGFLFVSIFVVASTSPVKYLNSTLASIGAVRIEVDGRKETKYVVGSDWSQKLTSISGDRITLRGGGRVYLSDSSNLDMNRFYQADLLGKTLTFDVDLSNVGCSCNGALYLVQMPAYNSAQQPVPGKDGDYYCDANQVGGTYCPEMDVMEANKYAMASTAHTCDYHAPHYYSTCDRGGCGTNVLNVNGGAFGPGKQIDTNKPFTLHVAFNKGGDGKLSSISNKFTQGTQSIEFNSCRSDYLQWMGYSLPGIVVTMSLWGTSAGGMSWLDGKSGCHEGCNLGGSSVSFSNIKIQ